MSIIIGGHCGGNFGLLTFHPRPLGYSLLYRLQLGPDNLVLINLFFREYLPPCLFLRLALVMFSQSEAVERNVTSSISEKTRHLLFIRGRPMFIITLCTHSSLHDLPLGRVNFYGSRS